MKNYNNGSNVISWPKTFKTISLWALHNIYSSFNLLLINIKLYYSYLKVQHKKLNISLYFFISMESHSYYSIRFTIFGLLWIIPCFSYIIALNPFHTIFSPFLQYMKDTSPTCSIIPEIPLPHGDSFYSLICPFIYSVSFPICLIHISHLSIFSPLLLLLLLLFPVKFVFFFFCQ